MISRTNLLFSFVKIVNSSKDGILLQFKRLSRIVISFDSLVVVVVVAVVVVVSICVFFHEHSRFTGQQAKGEGIYLTPVYHFHPLHRHFGISRAITAESSPLHIAGNRTRPGTFGVRAQVANHQRRVF